MIPSLRTLLVATILSTFFISCDSKMLIDVRISPELRDQGIALTDYDFTVAEVENSDLLHFEFVTTGSLNPATPVTFRDQDGGVLARLQIGESVVPGNAEGRSYIYSVPLEGFRSVSLVHKVVLGE